MAGFLALAALPGAAAPGTLLSAADTQEASDNGHLCPMGLSQHGGRRLGTDCSHHGPGASTAGGSLTPEAGHHALAPLRFVPGERTSLGDRSRRE